MKFFSSRRLPIGNTLIAALVLAALIPALLAAWLLSTNSSQSINTLAENAMSQAAHRVDVGALAHLGEAHTVVNALVPPFSGTDAEAARTRNWLVDTAAFETMAYALTQQSPNVPYLYMGTADGSFFGVEREDQGFVAREIRPGDPGRKHFLIGHPGDRSQLLREETQVYDPRKRPWYQLALSTGQRSFTDVYRSAVKSQFDLTLAHPIFDTDNRTVLGVVAVEPCGLISMSLLPSSANFTPLPEGWRCFLRYASAVRFLCRGLSLTKPTTPSGCAMLTLFLLLMLLPRMPPGQCAGHLLLAPYCNPRYML